MKKLFTLLTLALLSVGSAWAGDTGTESSGNQGSSNVSIVGKSYTLDGKFIAGKGGVQQGNMPDKGVKLRSNQGNLVFEVAAGYKITRFQFWGCGNTTTAVTIESATVDDGSNLLGANVVLSGKGEDTSGDIEEWINCRCSNAPYVMPRGMMAPPGMEQFREEDLIPIS